MSAASYSTREAEALYLMGKYDPALASLDRAISSTASPLFTLEVTYLDELKRGSKIPKSLRGKFKSEAGITLEAGDKVTVLSLSLSAHTPMWLIVNNEDRVEQLYLLLKQKGSNGDKDEVGVYQLTPGCARAFAHRGETYFQRGLAILRKTPYQQGLVNFNDSLNMAMANLNLALKLKPNYGWAYAKKGEICRVRGNQYKPMHEREQDYDEAIKCFDQAIALNPNYAWTLAHLGATLCNARKSSRYEEALDKLKEANRLLGGEYAWAVAYQGAVHLQRAVEGYENPDQEYDYSLTDLMTSIMMDNNILANVVEPGQRYRNIYLGFAWLLFKRGKYQESINFCGQALERVPKEGLNYARACYYLALNYKKLADPVNCSKAAGEAHRVLVKVANLLSHVDIEAAGPLTPKEEKVVKALSYDDKEAVEEICTMLLAIDFILDPNQAHLDPLRILSILETLFPGQEFKADETKDWFEQHPNRIAEVADRVIWQEEDLVEAIEAVKRAE